MKLELPTILEDQLSRFRRRVWFVKLAEGALAGVSGLVLTYLLVFAADRFWETPGWVRGVLLALGAAVPGIGLPWKWHRWVWRQRRLEDSARLLRRTFPRLGDQLLGIVELAHAVDPGSGRSERLVRAAMEQAAAEVKDRDFTHAVPEASHRRWAWVACGLGVLVVAAVVLTSDAAANALARWIVPWRTVERFTFTRLEDLPARLVVPYAEPFELPVRLASDTRAFPGKGWARIAGQTWVGAPLEAGACRLQFLAQREDGPLALSVGDYRRTIALQPRPRPELSELAVLVELPGYLGWSTKPRIEVRGGAVSVVRGARAMVEAHASRELSTARMNEEPQRIEGSMIRTGALAVEADATHTLFWRDVDGLTPRDPLLLKIRAVEDEAPRIVAVRESQEQVVLETEVVAFDLSGTDDFGVRRMGLEWTAVEGGKGDLKAVHGERVALAGAPEKREAAGRATFSAQREGLGPMTVEVRGWVEDYLPGRARAYSPPFVLHILNPADHALWLAEQFGKWLGASRESYDRELQLFEENKELRALDAAELDRLENRRRVAQQAAAEMANARRLENLTQSGRSLVEQATKNPEFDAGQLEKWAEMLKSLTEIASKRMPGVADLLKQSANASAKAEPNANAATPSPGADAPRIEQGAQPAAEPQKGSASKPDELPQPVVPQIVDREGGLSKPDASKGGDQSEGAKGGGGGKLGLPQTTLAATPVEGGGGGGGSSPAQAKMGAAMEEQERLLAEFAKVTDELTAILAGLESSTFVKRLKSASRQQMRMADGVSQKTLESFGIVRGALPEAEPLMKTAKEQSEFVGVIEEDLGAYVARKSEDRFRNILEEMRKTAVVRNLARNGEKLRTNLSGQTRTGAEFWADTLDRWAEELVDASKPGGEGSESKSEDSLPPELVLQVMKALRDEMKLRDQTREMQNAREALETAKFAGEAARLAEGQRAIRSNVKEVGAEIEKLAKKDDFTSYLPPPPGGSGKFAKELRLLSAVGKVMEEAASILGQPSTGPDAVAAETEVIEMLLQAGRPPGGGGGGGGGGGSAGGGGQALAASSSALSEFGPGADGKVVAGQRAVGQSTGSAGREFPAEFKAGLDAYFNQLEVSKQ